MNAISQDCNCCGYVHISDHKRSKCPLCRHDLSDPIAIDLAEESNNESTVIHTVSKPD